MVAQFREVVWRRGRRTAELVRRLGEHLDQEVPRLAVHVLQDGGLVEDDSGKLRRVEVLHPVVVRDHD